MSQLAIFPDPDCPTGQWPEGVVMFENRMARITPRACRCGAVLVGAAFLNSNGDGFCVHYTHPVVLRDGKAARCFFADEVEGTAHVPATFCK